jgi:hypothetical protein
MVGQQRARFGVAIAITLWCVFALRSMGGMSLQFKALLCLTVIGGLIESFESTQMLLHAQFDLKVALIAFAIFAVGMFGLKHIRPSEQHQTDPLPPIAVA